ncbi:MAG: HAD family hydrolase [Oscillospiraceae bacterium]|nr:HAD family hydrolase [Oscillospiraceae bacterium]
MSKTLYISDLDGTLLNKKAELTCDAKAVLNQLIASGAYFTVATARTLDTVLHILGDIRLNVPAVLNNGASIYDTASGVHVKNEVIDRLAAAHLFNTLRDYDITGFAFTFDEDIQFYYENLDDEHRRAFHDERSGTYGRIYTQVQSFSELVNNDVIYFSTCDTYMRLLPVYEVLKADMRLRVEFYRDVYHEHNWYLEICAQSASKYNAVMYLREVYGFERVVSFGDNLNDLPMFKASDVCIAVENARQEVKDAADIICGANESDGVAKWLAQNVLGV